MSLLNQVLRDLDAQKRPLSPGPSLRLAANPPQVDQPSFGHAYKWPLITLLGGVLLLITAGAWWWLREPPPITRPVSTDTSHTNDSIARTPVDTPVAYSPLGSKNITAKNVTVAEDQQPVAPVSEAANTPAPVKPKPTPVAKLPAQTGTKPVDYLPLHIDNPSPVMPAPRKTKKRKPVTRPLLHKQLSTRPLDKIRELIDQGALSHAEELLRKRLAKGSREPATHELLIGLMIQSGRQAEALEQIEKSLRVLQQNSRLELLHARLLIEQGHPKEALTGLNRLLMREPGNRQALRLKAGLLQRSGSTEEARKLYLGLVQLPDAIASDWLGLALTEDGKDAAVAAAAYRRVLGYPQIGNQVRQFARERLEVLR